MDISDDPEIKKIKDAIPGKNDRIIFRSSREGKKQDRSIRR